MQAVILAGGLGTRLSRVNPGRPKAMVPVLDKPFLHYQLRLLRASGFDEAVLCVGHMGEQVLDYFGDGASVGLRLHYSWERDTLLGTGGALRQALPLLADHCHVMYGDSYLALDYAAIEEAFHAAAKPGLMVVYQNHDTWDRSNVRLGDGVVEVYDKSGAAEGLHWIDEGVSVFTRAAVAELPAGETVDLGMLFQALIARGELAAWVSTQRFFEVGSESGLAEFQDLLAAGTLPPAVAPA